MLKHSPSGIPRAFDVFSCTGGREFDSLSLPGGGHLITTHWGWGSKRKIPDSWRTGWKAKACTSFVQCLKVFKNHLYYLWHNKNYQKVSRGGGIWSPAIWTAFRPREGGFEQKFSKNSNARGGCWSWYITFLLTEQKQGDDGLLNVSARFNFVCCMSITRLTLHIAGASVLASFCTFSSFQFQLCARCVRHGCIFDSSQRSCVSAR